MQQLTIQQALAAAIQHHQAGRFAEAELLYRQILSQAPNNAEALHLWGALASQVNRHDIAVDLIRRAIALQPNFPVAYNNLGNALQALARHEEAIESYRQALKLQPDYAETYSNLGNALQSIGQMDEAIASYKRAVELRPELAETHNALGVAAKNRGLIDESIHHFRQAIAIKPQLVLTHSNLLFTLNFHPDYDGPAMLREHQLWNQHHAEPLKRKIQPHRNDRSPDRRLKIGYVSPDFKEHSVAYFLEGLLAHHDPTAVEIFCYANVRSPDSVTARLQKLAHHWRDTMKLTHEQTAAKIREDQIDILVDLAGHTGNNRLLTFAEKPAPVQVTYLGYPNTTGLSAIDYRLTDVYADPPGLTDAFYTERLIRLAQTFLCFHSDEESPPIAALPALSAGHITFGCFNALPKITAEMAAVWSRILQALPHSRLLLKNHGLSDDGARRQLLELFLPDRVDLRSWIDSRHDHLKLYNQVDIALDTYPYHGTTTTCQALWMGVPVISLAGNSHRSRVGVSILSNVGLPELIAQTPDQLLQIALKLAGDLPRLSELRSTLRQKMQRSPLTDAPAFAAHIESAYRQVWRTWCASG
jgi:protein O-GlcNAc transferase